MPTYIRHFYCRLNYSFHLFPNRCIILILHERTRYITNNIELASTLKHPHIMDERARNNCARKRIYLDIFPAFGPILVLIMDTA